MILWRDRVAADPLVRQLLILDFVFDLSCSNKKLGPASDRVAADLLVRQVLIFDFDLGCSNSTLRPALHFGGGGTYSFGTAEPSPKKNCSNCLTITS